MKKQTQAIYKHFGDEKQRLKAKEERLELEIALNNLALYDVREEFDEDAVRKLRVSRSIGKIKSNNRTASRTTSTVV